jgi:hypothetical protein
MSGLGNFRIAQAFHKRASLTVLGTYTEIKMSKKISVNKVSSTVKDLLSTGLSTWQPINLGVIL